MAFLFIPINQIAYSYIPLEKNTKASSLTNLFRNEGGSFGIAAANTILARRVQFHQSRLVGHLSPENWLYRDWLRHTTQHLAHAGNTLFEAARKSEAELYALVTQQATLLSYLDCFLLFMIPTGVGALCCFLVKKFAPSSLDH
jgi:DHA2 family multidrug resistance protein